MLSLSKSLMFSLSKSLAFGLGLGQVWIWVWGLGSGLSWWEEKGHVNLTGDRTLLQGFCTENNQPKTL